MRKEDILERLPLKGFYLKEMFPKKGFRPGERSQIYVVKAGETDNYKVGVSNNPIKRIQGLQTGNHLKLNFKVVRFGTSALERFLHKTLSAEGRRIRNGGEWFLLDNFWLDFIKKIYSSMITLHKRLWKWYGPWGTKERNYLQDNIEKPFLPGNSSNHSFKKKTETIIKSKKKNKEPNNKEYPSEYKNIIDYEVEAVVKKDSLVWAERVEKM